MSSKGRSVFAHVVTFNSAPYIETCLQSLKSQSFFELGKTLLIHVTDNASSDNSKQLASKISGITLHENRNNVGFCAGHNQGASLFLASTADYFLILNPDVRLDAQALHNLVSDLEAHSDAGSACAKLYRADEQLNPVTPSLLDSAGMYLTSSLRHFDRGSDEPDNYNESEYVFGGTGACLLLRRSFVESMILSGGKFEADVDTIYPVLKNGREERALLFDEAFFAYREDADLAWRGKIAGWKARYVSNAVGFHRRVVKHTNRSSLPASLNRMGVRNRFLLQLNNFSFRDIKGFLSGILIRNTLVIFGVLLTEWGSIRALLDVFMLFRRAVERRRRVFELCR